MKKFVAGMVVATVVMVAGMVTAEPMMDKLNAKDDAQYEQIQEWNNMGE